jgi:hypothetical protein
LGKVGIAMTTPNFFSEKCIVEVYFNSKTSECEIHFKYKDGKGTRIQYRKIRQSRVLREPKFMKYYGFSLLASGEKEIKTKLIKTKVRVL